MEKVDKYKEWADFIVSLQIADFSCQFQIYERSNKFVTSEKHILIFTYLNHTKVY